MARQVDDFGPSSELPGGTAGLSAVFEVATWFGFEADLLYTQKGWRQGRKWRGLDYLEIPMLVRLAVPRTNVDAGPDLGFQPFFLGGPVHSVLVRCYKPFARLVDNPNSGSSGRPNVFTHQFGQCSDYERFHSDFGATVGVGVTLRRAKQHMTVEVRHTRGFSDARVGPRPPGCAPCTLTNRVTSVLVGAAWRM